MNQAEPEFIVVIQFSSSVSIFCPTIKRKEHFPMKASRKIRFRRNSIGRRRSYKKTLGMALVYGLLSGAGAMTFTSVANANITGTISGGTGGILGNNVINGNNVTITTTSFTGDVMGNLTGNVTGDVTGNVTGDVTGNLTGNVTGDVTGNLTGDVTGNLTGNVTGDVTGNLTGMLPVM
jgi:hypothetical protein